MNPVRDVKSERFSPTEGEVKNAAVRGRDI
jgi:hypothetical protein